MGRLVDIDSLKGCAIIRPTSHESIEHIKQCGNDVLNHNDIPTAYNVDAIVAELETMEEKAIKVKNITVSSYACGMMHKAIDIVKAGGVE